MSNGSSLGQKDYEKRSKLAHAKGFGSTYTGARDWLKAKTLSFAVIPLLIFLFVIIISGKANSYESMILILQNPFNIVMFVLCGVIIPWAAYFWVSDVIKDYIHNAGTNLFAMLLIKSLSFVFVIASVVSILLALK
jgi:succinate dehydrogenase / fumarate reductase membrane anchor subunit